MNTRRLFLAGTAGLGLSALLPRALPAAVPVLLTRPLPGGGSIPVIGMGTSGSFEVGDDAAARATLAGILGLFLDGGGRMVDTSPNYGSAEDVLGDLLAVQPGRARAWLATKLAATGRQAGREQFGQSLRRLRADRVDLLQVHNLRDWRTQLALARELKAEGKVGLVGLTHYLDAAHDTLAEAMAAEKPDFVQFNYSVASRSAERRLLPMARDLGIGVIVNRAFEDGRLFARVRDRPLPGWAAEIGARTWAQLFLKFVIAHPVVTCVIPATSKLQHQRDNLAAGTGPLLDARQREELAAAVA